MTLSALIRKRSTVPVATAFCAISAIPEGVIVGTVARIATIAVANPTEGKVETVATFRADNLPEAANELNGIRHYRWLVHFLERDPVHTCCLPEPTHVEVLAMYPDAIAAEPMPEITSVKPTPEQEAALLKELQTECRREKVIAILESTPGTQRAIYPDTDSDPNNVILAIAVRNVATCEMLIPKAKYDPWRLLELIEQQGGNHVN